MSSPTLDDTLQNAPAMAVTPVAPAHFDPARHEAHAREADARYAGFMRRSEGIAVWQRVRVAVVFRDGCRDLHVWLRWQLGGPARAIDYLTDAANYLEPWCCIGVTASAFGADYEWPKGQAPVVRPLYRTVHEVPDPVPSTASGRTIAEQRCVCQAPSPINCPDAARGRPGSPRSCARCSG